MDKPIRSIDRSVGQQFGLGTDQPRMWVKKERSPVEGEEPG